MDKINIDGIDKKILNELARDARIPVLEIARKAGISGAAIHQRLNKMKNMGLLEGSRVVINPQIMGYKTMAFIGLYLDKGSNNSAVVKQLENIPEVIECHYTTGNWGLLIKIFCKDNQNLMDILSKKIQAIDGVVRTETFISLEQSIDRQILL